MAFCPYWKSKLLHLLLVCKMKELQDLCLICHQDFLAVEVDFLLSLFNLFKD
ncbi:hypothetical protein QW060_26255 [Myroides ceti]|uniref:Uncharacterized protein n=1 Tax=Paenimyroides ceti TaxID=395087 RepID=A0ABT8D342_9FLAO|nr:hypothetical protein [Paenimyroides ceti]MDN3706551.1 hypothetical protein [Paenimyroides ceti]MDN3710295.1 hypothetical protein [Paenimyroides ceti]MDN3710333.1 hypothetical protein [Paenimyroides ceti]